VKAKNRDTALSARLRLAAEEMPSDVRERLRHRIVSQLDKAGSRPVAHWRVAVVQLAAMLVVAMTLLGGTAYAISRSQPGDFLYPVKESFAGIGLVLMPSVGQLPEEPMQRRVAPEPDPKPTERKEESRETEKRHEAPDAPDAPDKPVSEEADRDADKRQDSSEDPDGAASGKAPDEKAPVSGSSQGPEERDEAEYPEDSSEESRKSPRINGGLRNDFRESQEE